MSTWTNWAGNQRADAARTARPASTTEVVETIHRAVGDGLRVKAAGSGHSFSAAAATSGVRVELGALADLVSIEDRLITVQAGMSLRRLNLVLTAHGLALPNLGDIDAQSVAGALATGTHGSGGRLGCLSTLVEGLTLVTGAGEVLRCSSTQRPDVFAAARVGLGALGVVTEVTLRCVEAFTLRADERTGSVAAALSDVDELVADNDHVDLYWFPYTDRVQVKRNNRVAASDAPLPRWRRWLDDDLMANTAYGAACRLGRAAPRLVPTIARISAAALSARVYTGPSYDVFCTPRRVRFLEMEYALPRDALREAFDGLRSIVDGLPSPIVFPVEVRFVAGDDIWLSHSYGRDSVYIAVHQYVGMPYEAYFQRFEALASRLGGRPHWGKLHYREATSLAAAYPRFDDFRTVRDELDPGRVFANGYLERVLGA